MPFVCLPSTFRRALIGAVAAGVPACDQPVALDQLQRLAATEALGGEADTATTWRTTREAPVTVVFTLPPRVAAGEAVPVRVLIRNGGIGPMAVGLGQFDAVQMVVARVDRPAREGAIYGMGPMGGGRGRGAVITDPIRPGRDSTFEILWPQTDDSGHRVPPGAYRVRAVVNAQLVGSRRLWTAWDTVTVSPKR